MSHVGRPLASVIDELAPTAGANAVFIDYLRNLKPESQYLIGDATDAE